MSTTTTTSKKNGILGGKPQSTAAGLFRYTLWQLRWMGIGYTVALAGVTLMVLLPMSASDPTLRLDTMLMASSTLGIPTAFVVTMRMVSQVTGFLFDGPEAKFFSTLPIRRWQVLPTIAAAVALTQLVANLLAVVPVALLAVSTGRLSASIVLAWLVTQVLACPAYAGVCMLCASLTSRRWSYILLCGLASLGPWLVGVLLGGLSSFVLPGSPDLGMPAGTFALAMTSPAVGLVRQTQAAIITQFDGSVTFAAGYWVAFVAWAAVAVGYVALASLAYTHRRTERAGQAWAFRGMGVAINVVLGCTLALVVAYLACSQQYLLCWSTQDGNPAVNGAATGTRIKPWFCYLVLMASGPVLTLAASLLAGRGKGGGQQVPLRAAILGAGISAAVCGVICLAFATDALGVAHYVPNPADVSEAYVFQNDSADIGRSASPAPVQEVEELHRAILNTVDTGTISPLDQQTSLIISYRLNDDKDISSVTRTYTIDLSKERLLDPTSPAGCLRALYATDQCKENTVSQLRSLTFTADVDAYLCYGYGQTKGVKLTDKDMQRLVFQALVPDAQATGLVAEQSLLVEGDEPLAALVVLSSPSTGLYSVLTVSRSYMPQTATWIEEHEGVTLQPMGLDNPIEVPSEVAQEANPS